MDIFEALACADNESNDNNDEKNHNENRSKPKKTKIVHYTPNYYKGCRTEPKIPITKSGAFIKFDYLFVDDEETVEKLVKRVRKIENYFTLTFIGAMGIPKKHKCAFVMKRQRLICVPRFGIFEILKSKYHLANFGIDCQIQPGLELDKSIQWLGSLRHNQKVVCGHIEKEYFNAKRLYCGSAGCILNLEAGQGKSFVAAWFIARLRKKTAIIVHSSSMLKQWTDVLNACLSNVSVGYYYGKKKIDGDVVIHIINSAVSKEIKMGDDGPIKPIEYYNRYGFVILDECHLYANKFASAVFKRAQTPYMLGLSATPDENCMGFDPIAWWGIGPVLDATTIDGYQSTQNEFAGHVHRIMYYGPPQYTRLIKNETTDMVDTASTINMICDDPYRSTIAVDCIIKCLDNDLFTFVFGGRKEYLERLRLLLISRQRDLADSVEYIYNDTDYTRVVGGSTAEDLERASKLSKVIFTTYEYMGTGKSVPKMTGLVMVTPRKSKMKQYIKRVFRLGSDLSITRHIYDITDMKVSLGSQWHTRVKYYREKEFIIEEEKWDYKNIKIKGIYAEVSKKERLVGKVRKKYKTELIDRSIKIKLKPKGNTKTKAETKTKTKPKPKTEIKELNAKTKRKTKPKRKTKTKPNTEKREINVKNSGITTKKPRQQKRQTKPTEILPLNNNRRKKLLALFSSE